MWNNMLSRSAITKLQAILIVDLIITSLAAGGYFYLESSIAPPVEPFEPILKPAEFLLTNLAINQTQAKVDQPLKISVNVTNIGEKMGNYSVVLTIDDEPIATKTVQLSGAESTTVSFTATETAEGNHTIKIGSLTKLFQVTLESPTKQAELQLTNLGISRTEAEVGETITVSVMATNIGNEAGDFSLELFVNNEKRETKNIRLDGGETTNVYFDVVENAEDTYTVKVGDLTGIFTIMATAPLPKPAEFKVTDLIIDPVTVEIGKPVKITVEVTNIGEKTGNHTLELLINNALRDRRTIQLSGGEATKVLFITSGTSEGTYSVQIGDLMRTFEVTAPPTKVAKFVIFNLIISPNEATVGEPIIISVRVSNVGEKAGNCTLTLTVNDVVRETKTIQLLAGQSNFPVEFPITEENEGSYSVKIANLIGIFKIVPSGYHTLSISASHGASVEFTLDGQSYTTPYSALLKEGTYTIVMPVVDPTGVYIFLNWEDESTDPTRKIDLTSRISITAIYSGGASSCPSAYSWNGSSYVYISDVSNHGWLGYINSINEDGSIIFWRNDPWDYLKLDKNQLQLKNNNYYDLKLTQRWNEIFYLDAAYMLVIDHPVDVEVYSTGVEQYIDPDFMGKIYSVSKNPLTPISAINEKGEDVLPQISIVDGIFTPGINGITSPSWDNISWNRLTLDLGDLSDAEQIKLVVRGVVDWGSPDDYTRWIDGFFAQPVPNNTQITPPPYMEVKDADGKWIRVQQNRQFPIPPDVNPRTWVVDLTDLFPTDDYSLRINNFWNVTFDYIGVDITSQTDMTIQRINPSASLYQIFTPTSFSTGNFTKYGDVTPLVLTENDMFVIGRQGDEVSLKFSNTNLTAPVEGMERDFFLFVALWFKDKDGNWGYGFEFTVDPLPFHDMSGFPYPLSTESYPYDREHLSYLSEYNTRIVTVQ
jgi:hypothetical protein